MSEIKESLEKLRKAAESLESTVSSESINGDSVMFLHETLSQVQSHVDEIKQSLSNNSSSPIRYID